MVGIGCMLHNGYKVYFWLFMVGMILLIYIVLDIGNGYGLSYISWEDYVLLVCLVQGGVSCSKYQFVLVEGVKDIICNGVVVEYIVDGYVNDFYGIVVVGDYKCILDVIFFIV